MAKALGIGGIFFKCRDGEKLAQWYERHLGIQLGEGFVGASFHPETLPDRAYTIWGLFKEDTEYFNPSPREFMINLIVDDVEEALQQVVEGGAEQAGEVEVLEYGTFGWFIDPEGNKVELWKPA